MTFYLRQKHNTFRKVGVVVAIFLLNSVSPNSYAQNEEKSTCATQANTHFEQVLCRIKAKDASAKLPNLNEFRKNNTKMQYLLLKRPAKRLSITLKKPKNTSKKNQTVLSNPASLENIPTIVKKPISKKTLSRTITKPHHPAKKKSTLSDCELLATRLICPFSNYDLVTNISLKNIQAKQLSSTNQLHIEKTEQADLRYKTRVYRTYIEKMLSIGLGYSTMSFTKFSYIYDDSVRQGEDFTVRIFDMFELLKKERKTNSIKARYDNKTPASMSWCMNLSDKLIVCDNKSQNWVYEKS